LQAFRDPRHYNHLKEKVNLVVLPATGEKRTQVVAAVEVVVA